MTVRFRATATMARITMSRTIPPSTTAVVAFMPPPYGWDGCAGCDGWDGIDGCDGWDGIDGCDG